MFLLDTFVFWHSSSLLCYNRFKFYTDIRILFKHISVNSCNIRVKGNRIAYIYLHTSFGTSKDFAFIFEDELIIILALLRRRINTHLLSTNIHNAAKSFLEILLRWLCISVCAIYFLRAALCIFTWVWFLEKTQETCFEISFKQYYYKVNRVDIKVLGKGNKYWLIHC